MLSPLIICLAYQKVEKTRKGVAQMNQQLETLRQEFNGNLEQTLFKQGTTQELFNRKKTPNLSVGKAGVGRGYHIKFLGVRDYDPNQTCPHCQKPLAEVMDLLVISHDGTDDKEVTVCCHCELNIEK